MSLYRESGKRLFDVVVSAIALALTAPLHALCAALVATTGRPIYYRQERVGRDAEPFKLLKFRTMHNGTHEASAGYPTAEAVTRVGRVLRKTSLDEIPQLINILRGDMSLVGPRPALPEQVARYTQRQLGRLKAQPGLTGLAQIRYRNSAPWSKRIEADLEYVERITLLNDVRIILLTVPKVLGGSEVTVGQTSQDVDDLGVQSVARE